MRLAVLADVHAGLPALEAVLDDADRHRVDGIVVAGDLIGGPLSIETGRDTAGGFLAYARHLAAQAGFSGSDVIPDPTREQATATYDWQAAAGGGLRFHGRRL